MSKPSAWRRLRAREATSSCISDLKIASPAAPACWIAASASAKAVFNCTTGATAPATADLSDASALSAPPISAPNLICTSSATRHLKRKIHHKGSEAVRKRKRPNAKDAKALHPLRDAIASYREQPLSRIAGEGGEPEG